MSSPRDAILACMLCDASRGVDDVELPLAGALVRSHQGWQHSLGSLSRAQARHRMHCVQRIDQRLRAQRGNTALRVVAQRANREEPGCNRGTKCAGGRIASDN